MTPEEEVAFNWVALFTDRYVALGICLHVTGHGLPYPWMRDMRDIAAVLGLMGKGKEHKRAMAVALIAEGIAPPELVALAQRLDGRKTGKGRPPKSPLMIMRDSGLAATMRSREAQGQTLKAQYDNLNSEAGLSASRLRAILESHMADTAPRRRGRKKEK